MRGLLTPSAATRFDRALRPSTTRIRPWSQSKFLSTDAKKSSTQTLGSLDQRALSLIGPFAAARFPEATMTFAPYDGLLPRRSRMDVKNTHLIFSVKDSAAWHKENMARNPGDYSFLARWIGPDNVAMVQRRAGAAVWANAPFWASLSSPNARNVSPFSAEDVCRVSYSVIDDEDLANDLHDWRYLYVAGALHFPTVLLNSAEDIPDRLLEGLVKNRRMALAAGLLMLGGDSKEFISKRPPPTDELANRLVSMKPEDWSQRAEAARVKVQVDELHAMDGLARMLKKMDEAEAAKKTPAADADEEDQLKDFYAPYHRLRSTPLEKSPKLLLMRTGKSPLTVVATPEHIDRAWRWDLAYAIGFLSHILPSPLAHDFMVKQFHPLHAQEFERMYLDDSTLRPFYSATRRELWSVLPEFYRDDLNEDVDEDDAEDRPLPEDKALRLDLETLTAVALASSKLQMMKSVLTLGFKPFYLREMEKAHFRQNWKYQVLVADLEEKMEKKE